MDSKEFRHDFGHWISYLGDYLHNVFFKLILLFIFSFFGFGLYFSGFFKNNFIVAIVFLVVDLYLIKKLLYKRARPTKILVILVVLCIAFFFAQTFSERVFDNIGFTNFNNSFGSGSDINKSLSDSLVLSGVSDAFVQISNVASNVGQDVSNNISKSSKDQSIEIFSYINGLREKEGVSQILWDDKIYELAKYKAEDMSSRNYFDHPNPEGKCVGSYASNYGLLYHSNSFADNLFGYSSPTFFDQKEAVDSWMNSRGHKFNLFFPGHIRGAFACNNQNCVFIGQGGSGWVCDTGANGLAFWESAPTQLGE